MRVLDLFSGIGGIALGLHRAGMQTVGFCEIDPYCRRVLAKHWPGVWIHDDVRTLTRELVAERCGSVDLIAGGFPCQDVSSAGKRIGIEGPSSGLWREYARLICDIRPSYVVVENVPGLLTNGLDRVLSDLAACGFDAEWQVLGDILGMLRGYLYRGSHGNPLMRQQRESAIGQMNPDWTDWYAGFPPRWTDCEESETPLCLPSQSTSAD